ncbi:hypothetical protein HBB16_05850 [Pseudonocardia sp. MCCB 268]|nr:hypothetical protein [Pseudonocardia cytotoxica]
MHGEHQASNGGRARRGRGAGRAGTAQLPRPGRRPPVFAFRCASPGAVDSVLYRLFNLSNT